MRLSISILVLTVITLAGCMHEPVHQGNRLDYDRIQQIREGDTRFHVEQLLGTPVLDSTLHPNRAIYYEEFEDEENGGIRKRGIEITYDDALRVIRIEPFGFDRKK